MTGKTRINADAIDIENKDLIVTAAEGIENNDNDTTIPTSAAVKKFRGSLQASVNLNGSDGSINDSYEVLSATRVSLGVYLITLDFSMANTDYTWEASLQTSVTLNGVYSVHQISTDTKSTTQLQVRTTQIVNSGTALIDPDNLSINIFGERA